MKKTILKGLAVLMTMALLTQIAFPQHEQRVTFPNGIIERNFKFKLAANEGINYVIALKKQQGIHITVTTTSKKITIQFEHQKIKAGQDFFSEITKNGDHAIMLWNEGTTAATFDINIGVEK